MITSSTTIPMNEEETQTSFYVGNNFSSYRTDRNDHDENDNEDDEKGAWSFFDEESNASRVSNQIDPHQTQTVEASISKRQLHRDDTTIHDLEERLEKLTSNDDHGWVLTDLKSWRRHLSVSLTKEKEEEGAERKEEKQRNQEPRKCGKNDKESRLKFVRQKRKEARRHMIFIMNRENDIGSNKMGHA